MIIPVLFNIWAIKSFIVGKKYFKWGIKIYHVLGVSFIHIILSKAQLE